MKTKLEKLAALLKNIDSDASNKILSLSARYEKSPMPMPAKTQPAFKYIMYLKLMRGLEDSQFHYMKRKYLDTSLDIQQECQRELDKMVSEDALSTGYSSAEIRRSFLKKLSKY